MRLPPWSLAVLIWAGCDGTGFSDGHRSPCASGGQILGCEQDVQTAEDACWRLVECGVFPLDRDNPDTPEIDPDREQDFGGCVNRINRATPEAAEIAIDCVGASSCDALLVNDSPDAYEWPDCLEFL